MSDPIKHECGLAFIRLKKPLSFYLEKYGSLLYGINKLYLLMEKQHNRGQDGAGIATVKLDVPQGYPYLFRHRCTSGQAIADVFKKVWDDLKEAEKYQPGILQKTDQLKGHLPALGEIYLGHLRYGTHGKNSVEFCHPFLKRDPLPEKNLALAGNFNLVNVEELYEHLGMNPNEFQSQSDLAAMLEVVYHYLTLNKNLELGEKGIINALSTAGQLFDGGFTFGGVTGKGNSFIMRDSHGIRPAYYFENDEIVVAASERSSIRTTFNVGENEVLELMPGHALVVDKSGKLEIHHILPKKTRRACSFERIYFSRGSDEKIYKERKQLGYHLSKRVLTSINNDLKNTIFSYIPNTAEVAFLGLVKGMENFLNQKKIEKIISWGNEVNVEKLNELINRKIRQEKIAIKDAKIRTFITEDISRTELVQHVYDITYGTVCPGIDTLVVIDDSIVRGTTLKESIIRMLGRLQPKKITIVSSAPQIRYPDCYGIDMSKLGDFIAFNAALELLKERGKESQIEDLYFILKEMEEAGNLHLENKVKMLYDCFTPEEISSKVAEMIKPSDAIYDVDVIYQTIDDLHVCCPTNTGDWYFTGNYPTPGGNKVCNKAFLNFIDGKNERSY